MIIKALLKRNFFALATDRGRYTDMCVFPLTFLVTYGLLSWSNVISKEQSISFLLANLVWTMGSTVQTQANLCMMINFWSRESRELWREGIQSHQMFIADALFAIVIGIATLTVFSLAVPIFCGTWLPALRLLQVFPSLVLCALSVSSFIVGLVTYLGKSWGFLSWAGLQVIIMFSSPFVPIQKLPPALHLLSLVSPFTHLFEYVRNPDPRLLILAAVQATLLLGLGVCFSRRMVAKVKQTKGLHQL